MSKKKEKLSAYKKRGRPKNVDKRSKRSFGEIQEMFEVQTIKDVPATEEFKSDLPVWKQDELERERKVEELTMTAPKAGVAIFKVQTIKNGPRILMYPLNKTAHCALQVKSPIAKALTPDDFKKLAQFLNCFGVKIELVNHMSPTLKGKLDQLIQDAISDDTDIYADKAEVKIPRTKDERLKMFKRSLAKSKKKQVLDNS